MPAGRNGRLLTEAALLEISRESLFDGWKHGSLSKWTWMIDGSNSGVTIFDIIGITWRWSIYDCICRPSLHWKESVKCSGTHGQSHSLLNAKTEPCLARVALRFGYWSSSGLIGMGVLAGAVFASVIHRLSASSANCGLLLSDSPDVLLVWSNGQNVFLYRGHCDDRSQVICVPSATTSITSVIRLPAY